MSSTRRTLAILEVGRPSPLRVRFYRSGDRIANRIALHEPGYGWRRVLASIEGGAADDCPPSPVLQEIQRNRIVSDVNCGDAIMAIGAAGANRFSACVSCDRRSHEAEEVGFSFDVACRCGAPSGWLGSTYRLVNGAQAMRVGNAIHVLSGKAALQISAIVSISDATKSPRLAVRGDMIELACGEPVVTTPATVRWRYVVSRLRTPENA